MTAREKKLEKLLRETGAVREGTFILSSGQVSNHYVDSKKMTLDPTGALATAKAMVKEIGQRGITHAAGTAEGGIPIISHITLLSAIARGKPIRGFYNRQLVKAHGTEHLLEGCVPPAGTRVAAIEDVVSTGESLLETIRTLENHGFKAALAMTLVEIQQSGGERLRAAGYHYVALVRLNVQPHGTDHGRETSPRTP